MQNSTLFSSVWVVVWTPDYVRFIWIEIFIWNFNLLEWNFPNCNAPVEMIASFKFIVLVATDIINLKFQLKQICFKCSFPIDGFEKSNYLTYGLPHL